MSKSKRSIWVIGSAALFLLIGIGVFAATGWPPSLTASAKAPAKPAEATTAAMLPAPLSPPPPLAVGSVQYDFGTDSRADIGRWNSTTQEFKVRDSNGGAYLTYSMGVSGKAAPGDYNGDGKTDAGVFNAATGTWTYKTSTTASAVTISLGQTGDIAVAGDYDGDGATDVAVYRPSNGTWYVKQSSNGSTVSSQWGVSTDIPVPGNYDSDSKTDKVVFRPSSGAWHVLKSGGGEDNFQWGVSIDVPIQGDFDGDGLSDPTVYRPSDGIWYILKSSTSWTTSTGYQWGVYADQPAAADYDGDGKTDAAIWRPTSGEWYILKSSDSGSEYYTLGVPGETAVPSAYTKQVGGSVSGDEMAAARLDPKNATGGTNLYSQNFSWNTSLVSLPGRSGLDAGFGLSYNSLIWAKVGSSVYFNPDTSNVAPGFKMGFPTIEPAYYDSVKAKWAFMMVTPDGSRSEFRQTAASNVYETADSTYSQLATSGATNPNDPVENISIKVTTTDAIEMTYAWIVGAYRCTQIKDRNGNYISIAHDSNGRLATVTDTLGRVITVNYLPAGQPSTITQTWKTNNGSGSNTTHTWATLSYKTETVNTDFASTVGVFGPYDGMAMTVLDKVTYPDGSYTKFSYNGYLQVSKIENYAADAHKLNHVRTNLESPAAGQTDCPRFTETKTYAENFNGGSEVTTTNTITISASYSLPNSISGTATKITTAVTGHPDGLKTKTYVGASGWNEGLPIATENCISDTCSGTDRKRWTWTDWTQDNESLGYSLNPRPEESRVGDGTNTKKTTVSYRYDTATSSYLYGLPEYIRVYDTDLSTVLKESYTEYNLASTYTSRRIIGLPATVENKGRENTGLNLISRVTYAYDEGDFSDSGLSQTISPTQQDSTNYGASFIAGRGNLTSATRWDVNYPTTSGYAVTSSTKYNTAGSPVAKITPWDGTNTRTVKIGYADVWNDNVGRTTYAYPTTLTDPAGNSSTVKYRYDLGANVEATSPAPANQTYGKTTKRVFDSIGRLERDSVYVGATERSYTRYEFPTSGIQSKVYSTLVDTNSNGVPDSSDEVLSEGVTDGAGRVLKTRTEHPLSTGGWSATKARYDIIGRPIEQSVPTEVDINWAPAGDDAGSWKLNTVEYDWKGRVTKQINPDGTFKTTTYEGCGCAGGETVTVEGEEITETDWAGNPVQILGKRKQKIFADILGRSVKSQVYNWDGSIHSTMVNSYNGRDQVTQMRHFAGNEYSQSHQDTTATYDGHGRLTLKHLPIQAINTGTSYEYFADDSTKKVTDARGASKNFSYNNRGLVALVNYAVPTNNEGLTPWSSRIDKTGSSSILIIGGSFATNISVEIGRQRPENGYVYEVLGTFAGGQLTRGTLDNKQTIGVQFSSQDMIDGLAANILSAKVTNTDTSQATPRMHLWFYSSTSTFGSGYDDTVTPSAPVSFEYDNLGNRTSMLDEIGTTTYSYDPLSQLTSEARQITALNQTFTVGYTYGHPGELKSITDGFTATASYVYDKAGRLTTVNGTNYGINNPFVSNAKYRAWGAMKETDFGNDTHMTMSYNDRLLPTEFKIVDSSNGQTSTRGSQHAYYADGQMRKSDDLADNRFDRSYKYDQLGRLKEALSGFEARGEADPGGHPNRPFKQSYTYDAWDNRTGGTQKFWRMDLSQMIGREYVNNRAAGTAYDSDGRSLANRIDAAGRGIESQSKEFVGGGMLPSQPAFEIYQKFDGNGNTAKRIEIRRRDEEMNGQPTVVEDPGMNQYYLRSTVLGGKPVADIDATSGTKTKGYIYAGRQLIAEQNVCTVCNPQFSINWKETNPLTGGRFETNGGREEVDPRGAALGGEDPWLYHVEPVYHDFLNNQQPLYLEMGNPFDPNSPYEIDGLPVSAEEFQRRVGNDSVVGGVFHNGNYVGQVGLGGRMWGTLSFSFLVQRTNSEVRILEDGEVPRPEAYGSGGTQVNVNYNWNLSFSQRPRTGQQLIDAVWTKFGKKIEDCLKGLWSDYLKRTIKNEAELGSALKQIEGRRLTKRHLPQIDATRTVDQVNARLKRHGVRDYIPFYALPSPAGLYYHKKDTVIIDRPQWRDESQWNIAENTSLPGRTPLENAYVHELGNIASWHFASSYTAFNTETNPSDPDSGWILQKCVFGN